MCLQIDPKVVIFIKQKCYLEDLLNGITNYQPNSVEHILIDVPDFPEETKHNHYLNKTQAIPMRYVIRIFIHDRDNVRLIKNQIVDAASRKTC